MATVNHVRTNNYSLGLSSGARGFEAFWKLTRNLKKAGWKHKASSNGTTFTTTGDPALDKWGSSVTSNAGAAAASIAAPTRGRATVTGLTGIVAGDKGKFLLISGAATGANNNQHQIEEILSATSVRIDARQFAVASDANNGALTWSILDPLGDLYSTYTAALDGSIAWWCGQGPSILKIPITAASVGYFNVGENIVQATTGAEGELLGYTYYNNTGWLVVAPRLRGTGTGAWGWDTAQVVTGEDTGATVTQVGAAIDYVYEVVFVKPTANTTVQILMTQAGASPHAENTELFSYNATQAGCTATVHPGGGGTGNAFGAHAWVVWGTGTAAGTGSVVTSSTNTHFMLNGQYVCVDAIPEQDYSADGSWALFIPMTTSLAVAPVGGILYGFQRVENTEEGDLSPYVTMNPGGARTMYNNPAVNRITAGTVGAVTQTDTMNLVFMDGLVATRCVFSGWRARGVAGTNALPTTFEQFTDWEVTELAVVLGNYLWTGTPIARMAASANPFAKTRGPIFLMAYLGAFNSGGRPQKGSLKWMYNVSGDQVTDIYGTDPAWTQLSSTAAGSVYVLGPTDGTAWVLSQ